MSPTSPQADPSAVGGIAKAPFVVLPVPSRLFLRRAERFEGVATADAPLAPYLTFLAGISRAQAVVAADLAPARPISAEQRQRAREHAMPALDRSRLAGDALLHARLVAFFERVAPMEKPAAAAAALDTLRRTGPPALAAMIENVAGDAVPLDRLAEHLFVAAGLQVHAAELAATLDPTSIEPIGAGVCPVCGGPPTCSLVVGFLGTEGARYASCSLCGTLWNEVRIKCLACGSTKGVGYRNVETDGDEATIKAEVCDECRAWLKILYQNKNPSLDAVADDVASVGLDILMRDTAYHRVGFDPYLIGY